MYYIITHCNTLQYRTYYILSVIAGVKPPTSLLLAEAQVHISIDFSDYCPSLLLPPFLIPSFVKVYAYSQNSIFSNTGYPGLLFLAYIIHKATKNGWVLCVGHN